MPNESLKMKKQITKGMKTEFDLVIFYTTIALVSFGIVMVFSASYVQASFKHQDGYFFLKRDIIYAILGFVGMMFMSNIDYTFWKKNSLPLCIFTVICLALVLTPLGIEANGAKRWLGIVGATFQPSDIAKFVTIVITAKVIEKRYENIKSLTKGVIPILIIPSIFFILIMLQPNMSTAGTLAAGVGLFVVLVIAEPYRLKRFTAFLDPFQDPLGSGYQVIQSLYAIGSGGLFGLGLGKSRQKYFYIPEPQNDFIFAIIGEELGLIGCILVIMLFVILVYRCVKIALKSKDIFACMVVIGIGAQIGIQAAFNIAVATSSMPATGVALPFISYGGTSLTVLMGEIGIVLNISKKVKFN